MESIHRFFEPAAGTFFLFGPRGTGKSSWIKKALPAALRLDLLEPETLRAYSARPEKLRELAAAAPRAAVFVVDEVQRAPDLLNVVHALLEERKDLRFVLTGSSARKLRRPGVDLLAGRAVVRRMHPFMAAELGKRFSLERALRHGLVPLVCRAADPEQTLPAYLSLYLKEEVLQEGIVRNMGSFARFIEAISFSHGALLNIANVARECAVERKTAEGYVTIFEDLLLASRISVFTRRAQRATIAHPKLYFSMLAFSGPRARKGRSTGLRYSTVSRSKGWCSSISAPGTTIAAGATRSTSGARARASKSTSSCTAPTVSGQSRSRTRRACTHWTCAP
jgi:predicted AAA+ superfamily ATPase